MSNSSDSKLLDQLRTRPSSFRAAGLQYQLLEEYFDGLSLRTLEPLLRSENGDVIRCAVWIASELGVDACSVVNEVAALCESEDRFVKYHALESVAVCAIEESALLYVRVVAALEDPDQVLRLLGMRLISAATRSQLMTLIEDGPQGIAHTEGLRSLLEPTAEKARTLLLGSQIQRLYGGIMARTLVIRSPELIYEAQENSNDDVSKFAEETIDVLALGEDS